MKYLKYVIWLMLVLPASAQVLCIPYFSATAGAANNEFDIPFQQQVVKAFEDKGFKVVSVDIANSKTVASLLACKQPYDLMIDVIHMTGVTRGDTYQFRSSTVTTSSGTTIGSVTIEEPPLSSYNYYIVWATQRGKPCCYPDIKFQGNLQKSIDKIAKEIHHKFPAASYPQ